MRNAQRAGLAILMAAAAVSAGHAAILDLARHLEASARTGEIVEQRKDVDEVSRPGPPSGPATPVPFCSPGAPICP